MKYCSLTLLILFSVTGIQAQFKSYPKLPKTGNNMEAFVVDGWDVIDNSKGDLNKDGIDDIAFVLQSCDSIPADEDHSWSEPDYPCVLAIAFWDNEIAGYRLKVQANRFILTAEGDGMMQEPYNGMEIRKNGTLKFDFGYWYSAGTWYTGTSTYIFRYQNSRFELIGQELFSMHRATMESSTTSINYSTRKAILVMEGEESKKETKTASLELEDLPTFRTIGQAKFVAEVDLKFED